MAGLYIHIPFCATRCIYCGFYSTTSVALQDEYVDALCREMTLNPYRPDISTIYLGGGTPSLLSAENLRRLFSHIYKVYHVEPTAEVTMECNPDDIRPGMFLGLPVNRVSMGAQTFSDERLKFLHRRHTAAEVEYAVSTLRADGIDNISLDLMFGFPQETLAEWQRDIDHILRLRPEHISAYGLMYEEGTPLYRMLEQGRVEEVSEEVSVAMYDLLVDRLVGEGYEHYEISNFALTGRRSRHNSSYWHNIPYIGIGAAAHSYDLGHRYWNVSHIKRYMEGVRKGVLPREQEEIDERTHYNDLITTTLRTSDGLRVEDIDDPYQSYLMSHARPHLEQGVLALTDGRLHLTRAGIAISNSIMSDLIYV